ncbi:MAG: methylated-DNA-[protein]-cysteine S-methyltransferase [Thermodesulfobacteriota bacterium]|nr:methylated-DNA-[protein]-cysteine S-methyltransferase [Thermodesulfobacteriota bacterium]
MNYNYVFNTAFGYAALLFSVTPFNITRILLPDPDKKKILQEAAIYPAGKRSSHPNALLAAKSIQDYFLGKTKSFPPLFFEWMNFGNMTRLEKEVLYATASIPYGQTASYSDIAEAVGRRKAYRFVGNTVAKNPFPVIVPCHRVIKSDGSCGEFGGGKALKLKMLALEKAFPSASGSSSR